MGRDKAGRICIAPRELLMIPQADVNISRRDATRIPRRQSVISDARWLIVAEQTIDD